jgi:hypothetical protein
LENFVDYTAAANKRKSRMNDANKTRAKALQKQTNGDGGAFMNKQSPFQKIFSMNGYDDPEPGSDGSRKIVVRSPDLSTSQNFDFQNEQGVLSLEGLINEDSLKVVLRKKSENSFVLSNRGFHWVGNEPFCW